MHSKTAPLPEAPQDEALKDDLLEGAGQIADFLYGNSCLRRKVYHLAQTSRIPLFRLGSVLCGRRSTLKNWIKSQEERGWKGRAGCTCSSVPSVIDRKEA
jgi:hypothetical protein